MTSAELRNTTATYNKMTLKEMKTAFPEPEENDTIQVSTCQFVLNFSCNTFYVMETHHENKISLYSVRETYRQTNKEC